MNINLERILAWDIETAPKEEVNENHPLFKTWKNRNRKEFNKETGLPLSDKELLEKFKTEGGLYGEYLNIVCISCAFIHDNQIRINSYVGDEKTIIDEFLKVVAYVSKRSNNQLVSLGHNVQNFDVAVLRKVYSRYYPMFTFPNAISDINTKGDIPTPEKPWVMSEKFLDTLQLQKGSNYMFSSMAETAINLGLESPKLDTDGSQVATLFRNGEIDAIARYCEGDVLKSFEILFSWMGLDMLPVAGKTIIKELTLLEKLNLSKTITEENKAELNKILAKKRITKKEKEIILDIVKAALSDIDDDFGKIKNERDVDELIKQLR